MSKSKIAKVIAMMGLLLRSGRRSDGNQQFQEQYSLECSVTTTQQSCLRHQSAAEMPIAAVGRTLGYTTKELLAAAEVLGRFAWRRVTETSREEGSKETEPKGIACDWDDAA